MMITKAGPFPCPMESPGTHEDGRQSPHWDPCSTEPSNRMMDDHRDAVPYPVPWTGVSGTFWQAEHRVCPTVSGTRRACNWEIPRRSRYGSMVPLRLASLLQ